MNISDEVRDHKDILFDILHAAGVEEFAVNFEGSGDDGQIEEIGLDDKILEMKVEGVSIVEGHVWDIEKGVRVEKIIDNLSVKKFVEKICYDVLEGSHCGWENNEGSYGTFDFDVTKRSVTLVFNERVTEINETIHKF
jgi:hypothetical protein